MFTYLRRLFQANTRPTPTRRQRFLPSLEDLERRELMSVSPVEFQVNTKAIYRQFESVNASAPNGRSVVVWTDEYNSSGTDTDIKAQLFDAAGHKLGGEITVASTWRAEHQPAVAMDANGNFAVSWTEDDGTGAYNQHVLAQRFAADGSRLGGLIHVGGTAAGSDSSVALDGRGNLAVAMTEPLVDENAGKHVDDHVKVFAFNSAGAQLSSFDAYTAKSGRSNDGHARLAESAASDRLVLAYHEQKATGTSDIVVIGFGSLASLGQPRFKDHIVNGSQELNPSVAVDNTGNAVVAYQSYIGSDWDVKAVRVSATGALGSQVTIANSTNDEVDPTVALDPTSGKFVVAYTNTGRGSIRIGSHVEVVEVSATNTRAATIVLPGWAGHASLSMRPNHGYFLTYDEVTASTSVDVFGRWGSL
jgi:hypothetical protein